jgi:hypothetical protein
LKHLPTNLLCVTEIPYGQPNDTNWILSPSTFGGLAATAGDLPLAFLGAKEFAGPAPYIPYSYNGHDYALQFRLTDGNPHFRHGRAWWGYPPQILIPLTLTIDFATSPIQLFIFSKELRRSLGD